MANLEDLTVDQLLARAKELEQQLPAAQLLRSLSTNPKTRETVQRAIKTLNPEVSIPELDAKEAAKAEFAEPLKKLESLERTIQERDIRDRLERQRAQIKAEFKLSDDDMLGVEKLMTAENDPIPTYRAAAQVFVAQRQSAVPTSAAFQIPTFEMPETDIWGKGIGNKAKLDKIAMSEANKALQELMSGKVPGLGSNRVQ